MILSHQTLVEWGINNCTPFEQKYVNPSSIDLTVSNKVRVLKYDTYPLWRKVKERLFPSLIINKKSDPNKLWSEEKEFKTFILKPWQLALFSSVECTSIPDNYAGVLFSKSSVGRIGLEHLHSGFGDAGFSGHWTFELLNVLPYPIEITAGETLLQLVLLTLDKTTEVSYREVGRYNGQTGPTTHRIKSPHLNGVEG